MYIRNTQLKASRVTEKSLFYATLNIVEIQFSTMVQDRAELALKVWGDVFNEKGIEVKGVAPIPRQMHELRGDRTNWFLVPMTDDYVYEIPPFAYDRYLACKEAHVPFSTYVWVEEGNLPTPNYRKLAIKRQREIEDSRHLRRLDPILLGIIHLNEELGLWCEIARWDH